MAELLKDEEFCRWVKSVMALEMTRSPLSDFVEPVIIKRHKEIVDKMYASGPICSLCSFENADNCPSCKIVKNEITMDHRHNRPTFKNTSLKNCVTNPWELAKCYMAAGYEKAGSLTDTDTVGFLQLIVNNEIFQQHTSENLDDKNNIFRQVREVRNFIMHSPENRITKSTFDNQMKTIVGMLQSLHTSSSKRIIPKMKQLQADRVSLEDIHHANSEAVKFFKNYETELRERMKECENRMAELEDTISRGEEQIGESIERGVDVIKRKIELGEMAVQDATKRGTKLLREKTEAGIHNIEDKTHQSTKILEEQQKAIDKDFREKGERLSVEISKLTAVKSEALDKAQDIKATVDLIDEKTNNDIDAIHKVTQICMERICDQTKSAGEFMQDIQNKLGDDFTQRTEKMIQTEIEKYKSQMTFKVEEADTSILRKPAEMTEFDHHETKMIESDIVIDKKPAETSKFGNHETRLEEADIAIGNNPTDIMEIENHERKQIEDADITTNKEKTQLQKMKSRPEPVPINVRHSDDDLDCWIAGMAKIDTRRLAVVDEHNMSVKIIDVESNTITDHLRLSNWPKDIACIDETCLVVTCQGNKLLVLRFDGKLREVNTEHIEMDSEPHDVVSLNGEIGILCFNPDPCIKTLSLDGKIKRIYRHGLKYPTHITADKSKSTVYVSDRDAQCVTMIYLTNDNKQHRTLSRIPQPSGITVTQEGTVYVVDEKSHCILQISPDGDTKTLIDRQDLRADPNYIEYCQMENKLYIGFSIGDEIVSYLIDE